MSTGLVGDAGNDILINEDAAEIVLEASASTTDTSVASTLAGMSAAESTAIANATGIGLDGGHVNDTVVNNGTIRSQNIDADAIAPAFRLRDSAWGMPSPTRWSRQRHCDNGGGG